LKIKQDKADCNEQKEVQKVEETETHVEKQKEGAEIK
jgi:hypothetical protein